MILANEEPIFGLKHNCFVSEKIHTIITCSILLKANNYCNVIIWKVQCEEEKEEKNRREGRSFLLELAHDDIVQDDLSYGL